MLFNSLEFLIFLPITLAVYFLAARIGRAQLAIASLTAASMLFYAWWNPKYLLLILAEIIFCYWTGRFLAKETLSAPLRRLLAVAAIGFILLVLGYFKYTNFLLGAVAGLVGNSYVPLDIVLPLGISFHSFQQIAYIADAYRRRAPRYDFNRYCLFVTFFPQLIAGPIVHHHELIPQLGQRFRLRPQILNITVGLSIFAIGLFKKTIIADTLGQIASPIFLAATNAQPLSFAEAWCAAFAYTFQLYFDFSAYSDMAIGLARLFNLRLPVNFYSPYKATNIADFWRRWHITLSRFLRDYLYIPLGGSRRGLWRKNLNLVVTMLLGGLWHGAGWTFVLWGGFHGLMLVTQSLWATQVPATLRGNKAYIGAAWLVTFLAVVCGWVLFRSPDLHTAQNMYAAMTGLAHQGFSLKMKHFHHLPLKGWYMIAIGLVICLAAPNTIQIFRRFRPALTSDVLHRADGAAYAAKAPLRRKLTLAWRPTLLHGVVLGLVFGVAIVAIFGWQSEFLYFQF